MTAAAMVALVAAVLRGGAAATTIGRFLDGSATTNTAGAAAALANSPRMQDFQLLASISGGAGALFLLGTVPALLCRKAWARAAVHLWVAYAVLECAGFDLLLLTSPELGTAVPNGDSRIGFAVGVAIGTVGALLAPVALFFLLRTASARDALGAAPRCSPSLRA